MTTERVRVTTIWIDPEEFHPTVWLGPDIPGGTYTVQPTAAGRWVLAPQPESEQRLYRGVDRYGRGWLTCNPVPQTYPDVEDSPQTLEQLIAERGPLIPVLPPLSKDTDELCRLLAGTGVRAVGTLLAALYAVDQACHRLDGHGDRLVAGRPGSWESAALPMLAQLGDGLVEADDADDRAAIMIADILHCWVFGETRFVEVAENLARVFGKVIDGRGGWNEVTDEWLRDSGYEEQVRGLLASQSRWYGPGATLPHNQG